jgi:GDP-mannose 6-dehydrogenase
MAQRPRHVAVLGLAFKSDTDDLRESPAVALVKRLIGEGCEVAIYAPGVDKSRIMGANLSYIKEHLPHFEALLVDQVDGLLDWSDVVVITSPNGGYRKVLDHRARGIAIIDLGGQFSPTADTCDYFGIAW